MTSRYVRSLAPLAAFVCACGARSVDDIDVANRSSVDAVDSVAYLGRGDGSDAARDASAAADAAAVGTDVGTDAAPCIVPPLTSDAIDVRSMGAVGDGVADDTDAIQAAVEAVTTGGTVYVPDGTYMIRSATSSCGVAGIDLRGDMTLLLAPSATLAAIPNGCPQYAVVHVPAVQNVVIAGGTIAGDRDAHTGTTGAMGMGLDLHPVSDVEVRGVHVRDCWGDGIYIAGPPGHDVRIRVCGTTVERARRNGISITNGTDVTIEGTTCSQTRGTIPGAGLDIEPNDGGRSVTGVTIRDSRFFSNSTDGILVAPVSGPVIDGVLAGNEVWGNLDGVRLFAVNGVVLEGNRVHDNQTDGLVVQSASAAVILRDNDVFANSASSDGASDNILVEQGSHDTVIDGDTCRVGPGASRPAYGVHITSGCARTQLTNNDLRDGGVLAPLLDEGYGTVQSGNQLCSIGSRGETMCFGGPVRYARWQ